MLRKVPRELALVELPQTRTEVVSVNFHAVVHLIEKIRESVWLPLQAEEDVEGRERALVKLRAIEEFHASIQSIADQSEIDKKRIRFF